MALPVIALVAGPMTSSAGATAPQSSPNFAGYELSQKKVTSGSATVVVPTITCKKNTSGVGPSVILDSAKGIFSGAGVGVGCQHKQPTYEVIIAVNAGAGSEQDQAFVVAPKDKLNITVNVTKGKTKVAVQDVTSAAHKTLTGGGRRMNAAEVGVQSLAIGAVSVGIDPFTTVKFTHCLVNGKPLSKVGAFPVDRKHGKTLQISVSKLSKGRAFTTKFKHT
jgi:hypothetical protein